MKRLRSVRIHQPVFFPELKYAPKDVFGEDAQEQICKDAVITYDEHFVYIQLPGTTEKHLVPWANVRHAKELGDVLTVNDLEQAFDGAGASSDSSSGEVPEHHGQVADVPKAKRGSGRKRV